MRQRQITTTAGRLCTWRPYTSPVFASSRQRRPLSGPLGNLRRELTSWSPGRVFTAAALMPSTKLVDAAPIGHAFLPVERIPAERTQLQHLQHLCIGEGTDLVFAFVQINRGRASGSFFRQRFGFGLFLGRGSSRPDGKTLRQFVR